MEKDPEITGQEGSHYTAPFWQYDTRIGRRWNVDPVTYAWQSSYATFNCNPILFADPLGLFGTRDQAKAYKKEHNIKGRVGKGDDGYFYIRTRSGENVYHITQNITRANTDYVASNDPIEDFNTMYADKVGEVSGWYKFWHPKRGTILKNSDFPNGVGASRKGKAYNTTETSDLPGAPGKARNVKLPKTGFDLLKYIVNAEQNAEKAKSIIDKTEDVIEKNKSDEKPAIQIPKSEHTKQDPIKNPVIEFYYYDSISSKTMWDIVPDNEYNRNIIGDKKTIENPLSKSEHEKLQE